MMKANKEFVEVEVLEAKTGFAITDSNIVEGRVVSVGGEVTEVKKGSIVIFDTHKAVMYPIKGKNHYFVREETIFAYEIKK